MIIFFQTTSRDFSLQILLFLINHTISLVTVFHKWENNEYFDPENDVVCNQKSLFWNLLIIFAFFGRLHLFGPQLSLTLL